MRLLVLGGTAFVGAAVVDDALGRGWQVTTFNRGTTGTPPAGVEAILGDRTRPADVERLTGSTWDAVVDTWSGDPRAVRDAACILRGLVGHYGYVSSRSVYRWPIPPGADESAPVVDASPDNDDGEYPAQKRGGELAVLREYGDALLARAGLILGPREDVGRLPWWLQRMARGGDVLAPGPPDRPLQYVDARDLAAWLLDGAEHATTGAFNVVSEPGHATTRSLLESCRAVAGGNARLEWVDATFVLDAGIEPWTELPIWLPPEGELAGLHAADVSRALDTGLRCRPVEDTVHDTWEWLQREGPPADKPGRPRHGLDPDKEWDALAAWRQRAKPR